MSDRQDATARSYIAYLQEQIRRARADDGEATVALATLEFNPAPYRPEWRTYVDGLGTGDRRLDISGVTTKTVPPFRTVDDLLHIPPMFAR